MKKHLRFLIVIILLIMIGVFINPLNVYAQSNNSLHEKTKIYDSSNGDYFLGCEDYDDYKFIDPTITVLTHGLGGQYFHWSNDYSYLSGRDFTYNEDSIISKIYNALEGNLNLYCIKAFSNASFDSMNEVVSCEYSYFEIYNIPLSDYMFNTSGVTLQRVDHINPNKHIVILFDSNISGYLHQNVYEQFHNVLDNISLQFYNLTGILPKYNLVGHSRGGVINLMYATDHIFNVSAIYSMGTPYSGSTLGLIDPVMYSLLSYYETDLNGNLLYNNNGTPLLDSTSPGVIDILSEEVSIELRDKWNAAYKEDIAIDVVAYGSATSIDFLRYLVEELITNPKYSYYGNLLNDYLDLINSVINVFDSNPITSNTVLNIVNGLAQIPNEIEIDLYDGIITIADENLEGQITAEEVDQVISLLRVINNQAVIMDDLFIDTNSQLGYGFSDDIEYEGFQRYMKIFTEQDLVNASSAVPSEPNIPHNLEIMNSVFIDEIVASMEYGTFDLNINTLTDGYNQTILNKKSISYSFSTLYEGERTINATGCNISILYYDVNGNLHYCNNSDGFNGVATSNITFKFEVNKEYLIIIDNALASQKIEFNPADIVVIPGYYSKDIKMNSGILYGINVEESGYYYINTNDSMIEVTNGIDCGSNIYWIYLNSDIINLLFIKNNSDNIVDVTIELYVANSIDFNENVYITSSNRVVKFTNTNTHALDFKIDLNYGTTFNSLCVYDEDSNFLDNVAVMSNSEYSFTLSGYESCYIVLSTTDSTDSIQISLNEDQLKWKVNGVIITNTEISLPAGYTYELSLWMLMDNSYVPVEYKVDFQRPSNTNFTIVSDNSFSINPNANINSSITIECDIHDYPLTINVEQDFNIMFSSSNNQTDAYLYYQTNKTSCVIKGNYSNSYGTFSFSLNGSNTNLSVNVSNYVFNSTYTIPKNTEVTVNSIIYQGMTFILNTQIRYNLNVTFGGGSGTISDPYQVNCYRHLNNVRNYTGTGKYFVQTADIVLETNWTPIPQFYGYYDGASYDILCMEIVATTGNYYYGFVGRLYGTIKNIEFGMAEIVTQGIVSSSNTSYYMGVVCGYAASSAIINNCEVNYNSLINSKIRQSYIGGIAGCNFGDITDCYADIIADVSGYSGGITGYNDGYINNCYTFSYYTYYWSISNGYLGGIAGVNAANGEISNCTSLGIYIWDSTDDSDGINPYVGGIIGYNNGTYSNCSCTNDVDEFNGIIKKFLGITTYNQEKYCFAVDNQKVGYDNT